MYRHRRGGPGGNLGVLLLAGQVFNMGLENIPPVTLGLVAGQTAIFLGFLPQYFYSSAAVCVSSYLVWHRLDYRRLFLAQVFHADDLHLYFNMASLLLKGRMLERRFGSLYFAWMVCILYINIGLLDILISCIGVILHYEKSINIKQQSK